VQRGRERRPLFQWCWVWRVEGLKLIEGVLVSRGQWLGSEDTQGPGEETLFHELLSSCIPSVCG